MLPPRWAVGASPARCPLTRREGPDQARRYDPDGRWGAGRPRRPARTRDVGNAVRAAVCRGVDQPIEGLEGELPPPGPGQVRVHIAAAGVCHSDLSLVNGTLSPGFPVIPGHEAAGVVTEVG